MYICSVLLYRCYLSVYSPFLVIVDAHSVACLMPVCREVGLKAMCLVSSHSNGVSLYKSREQQTIKCTKMCLVSNRPDTSSSTLGIIIQSHLPQPLFHLGSVRTTCYHTNDLAQTVCRVRCALIHKRSVSRGTGSTFDVSQHKRRV